MTVDVRVRTVMTDEQYRVTKCNGCGAEWLTDTEKPPPGAFFIEISPVPVTKAQRGERKDFCRLGCMGRWVERERASEANTGTNPEEAHA